VFVVHGTRTFLDPVGKPAAVPIEHSTTLSGDWYATAPFWKPQVALFVNESTLLPVLLPLAPAATVLDRLPAAVATVLGAHAVSRTFIEHEVAEMSEHRLATTSNRSVVGIMNEFSYLGRSYRLPRGVDRRLRRAVPLAGRDALWTAARPTRQSRSRAGSARCATSRLIVSGVRARRDPGAATNSGRDSRGIGVEDARELGRLLADAKCGSNGQRAARLAVFGVRLLPNTKRGTVHL
jgi:hypothetical protein